MTDVLRVHPSDNVLVALRTLRSGETVTYDGASYTLAQAVPAKHKLVTRDLAPGDAIIMYGVMVGRAAAALPAGSLLTTKNTLHDKADFETRTTTYTWQAPDTSPWRDRHFMGYHRSDGQVGTANHWLVLPLVFCENRNIDVLKAAFERALGYASPTRYQQQVAELVDVYRNGGDSQTIRRHTFAAKPENIPLRVFPNVDGVHFLRHDGGCGGTWPDARSLCGLFAGYLHNPNVAGATILSLGCQNAQVDLLREEIHRRAPEFDKPLLVFEQQRYASTHAMLSDAIRDTFAALIDANRLERRPASLRHLTFGVECGGSDGFSGLSANPAIGYVSDVLTALGGTVILAEFPELSGVEQALIDRCVNADVAERFAALMRAYTTHAAAVGSSFAMNPSPGNIRDGLLTDAMKSAGAARKGGTSPVTAALDYPEYAVEKGLNLLCTPGGDVESTTGLAGAGATIILFSTGMGTPTGNPIAPVLKISSNSDLARRLPDLIDVDAGPVITGTATIEETGTQIFEHALRVASGEAETKATRLRQFDFIPWKRGVSL